jgi:hypothetical protein
MPDSDSHAMSGLGWPETVDEQRGEAAAHDVPRETSTVGLGWPE